MDCLFEFDKREKNGIVGALEIQTQTYKFLLGTDEAGRGPAAGGVFAACVCFFDDFDMKQFEKLNDSKKMNEKNREELFEIIKANSFYSINCVEVEKIEKTNILSCSLFAMQQSVKDVLKQLNSKNNDYLLLVDGNQKIRTNLHQKTIIKGDSKSAVIAAASVLAKVARDNYMRDYDKKYPQYNFKTNKGYLTREHIEAIKKHGVTSIHRKSFLKNVLNQK